MIKIKLTGKVVKVTVLSFVIIVSTILLISLITLWVSQPLFDVPYSTVVESSDGRLMSARIASDGQWRFPHNPHVIDKFSEAIVTYEDKRFYYHPGVDPLAICRAVKNNFLRKRVVSGASTITMQLSRLVYGKNERTIAQKIKEIFLSLGIELMYSKKSILSMYASHAPFGGNVVGLDAASWRYYGIPPDNLSWADAAVLAVLPNSPSMIHPAKNADLLEKKRNALLYKLHCQGKLDTLDYMLATAQPLPKKPCPLPNKTPHMLNHAVSQGLSGQRIKTTLNYDMQESLISVVNRYNVAYSNIGIYNMGVLVLDTHTGEVLGYVGNTSDDQMLHENSVNMVTALRSSGSTLKPFLFAAMIQDGVLLPEMFVPDIPTTIAGYTPKNFFDDYDGVVPANSALIRSMNIPMVRMLYSYGLNRFYQYLKQMNFPSIRFPANHYGLSLILGGAEVSLWELTAAYASMGRVLINYRSGVDSSASSQFWLPYFTKEKGAGEKKVCMLSPVAIYQTLETLTALNRPVSESGWEYFSSSGKIAWKTGTSFGYRDAWSVGVTPQYTIGVWVGKANGEGHPGLTGVSKAAPVMMTVFSELPRTTWFSKPIDEMISVKVCKESGFLASQRCAEVQTISAHKNSLRVDVCPYHYIVHLDSTEYYRVNSSCYDVYKIKSKKWFLLPHTMEWYYKRKNPQYRKLPPIHPDCSGISYSNEIELIYPDVLSGIFIPRDLDGRPGKVVFKATHRQSNKRLYWYVDEQFMGETMEVHEMPLRPEIGRHVLTVSDENGNIFRHNFEVKGNY